MEICSSVLKDAIMTFYGVYPRIFIEFDRTDCDEEVVRVEEVKHDPFSEISKSVSQWQHPLSPKTSGGFSRAMKAFANKKNTII